MASTYSISKLIAPVTKEQFLAEYWEKKPLLIRREDRGYYGDLLSVKKLEHAITAQALHRDMCFIANASRQIDASEYTYPDGIVDASRLFQQFAEGGTIVFNQLHTVLPELAEFCRSLEREISCRFQTNIYLTPNKAQGFPAHYDSHDVFVLQFHGVKHWLIYNTPIELPFKGQPFRRDETTKGEVTMEFDLRPGDMLYLPRGIMHDAQTREGETAHITLGALTTSWTELLLEVVAKVALTDVDFRRALPPGFATTEFDRTASRAYLKKLLGALVERGDLDQAMDHFADELVSTRRALLDGQLEQILALNDITPDHRAGARSNLVYRYAKRDGQIVVSCYGAEMRLPEHAAEPLLYALESPDFRIKDLPGDLDDAGKVVLVKRLVREGMVAIKR
ncbi:MAG: cupin domain-containing protein [Sandaracinaceae bacterium]|nr:cupin domain-containing protein [Sandaracinaceae bacterium]